MTPGNDDGWPEGWQPDLADGFESRWFGHYGVVASPGGASHLRLEPTEFKFTNSLDGTRTVEDLVTDSGDDAFEWLEILWDEGFLAGSSHPGNAKRFVWTRQGIEMRGFDRFSGTLYRRLGKIIFHRAGVAAVTAASFAGFVILALALADGSALRPQELSPIVIVVAIELAEWAAVGFHELAHALVAKWAGRRVGRVGMGFYWGSLSFYVDASDTMLADRPKRILQASAGCIADATWAGIALIASVIIGTDTTASELLRMFAVLRYISVGLNLVPLLELDGYWVLADVLDEPDLRANATAAVKDAPRALRDRARRGLVIYGAASFAFGSAMLVAGAFAWWHVFGDLVVSLFAGSVLEKIVGVYFVLPHLVMAAHLARNAALALARRNDDHDLQTAIA